MPLVSYTVPEHVSPTPLSAKEKACYFSSIKRLLKLNDAVLVAHYYTDAAIQQLAEESGGIVSDSLEMARFGKQHSARTLLVAGVYFMGETAKILSPEKRVLMPTLEATCSLDLSCPIGQFSRFCDQHAERTVVVYANTSAAVKARADWVVTSSIALDVIEHLSAQGESILWAPDRYLGDYLQKKTGADILLWDGACVVHEEFKKQGIEQLKALYPEAGLLVHPESPLDVIEMADAVGSTSALIKAAETLPQQLFIVATDRGILYKMQQMAPGKSFIEAPTGGTGANCKSCAHCPWMAMNSLAALEQALLSTAASDHEIHVPEAMIIKARLPLNRMLEFQQQRINL